MTEQKEIDRGPLLIAVVGVVVFAAWLRLHLLGGSSLWLDEILNVEIIRAMDLDVYQWFLGFERENGPLYFGLHSLSLRAPMSVEYAFRLPEAVAGIIGVGAIAWVALRVTGRAVTSLVAAMLLACSPLHVYYSREGRPYALLVLATIGVAWALSSESSRRRSLLLAVSLLLASATAATAAPLVLTTLVITAAEAWWRRRSDRDSLAIGAPLAAVAYLALLYARFEQPSDFAGLEMSLRSVAVEMLNSWVVTSEKTEVIAILTLLMAGCAVVGFVRMEDRRAARILGTMMILLPAFTILALVVRDHWYSVRYTILGLVPFVLLAATGLVEIARFVAVAVFYRFERSSTHRLVVSSTLAVLAAALIAQATFVAARTESSGRADWRRIARILANHAADGEFVIAADEWSAVCLRFYLQERGRSLDVRSAQGSLEVARGAIERRKTAWIVSGGYGTDRSIRSWACRFFLVTSDEEESVRLHFAPDLIAFVQRSATASERDRFVERFYAVQGGRLEMGSTEQGFFRDGWYGPESVEDEVFRWSRSESSIVVPVSPRESILRFKAAAFDWPGHAQRLTLSTGGQLLAVIPVATSEVIYEVALPSTAAVTLLPLSFRFDWEVRPEEAIRSGDTRPLAASFHWIEVDENEASTRRRAPVERLDGPILFVVDGGEEVRVGPCEEQCAGTVEWDLPRTKNILLALGRGPGDGVRQGIRARFADTVVSSMPPRDCFSDIRFVEALYPILLLREPDRVGLAFYLAGLRSGWSRQEVVCRMTRSEEFAKLWFRH